MKLRELFARYDTDKDSTHSYGRVYESLFAPWRERAQAVLEIGVLTGGSLRAWRDYFPNAVVIGIDVDPARQITEERITTVVAHQCDYPTLDRALGLRTFDIVIDDGSHHPLDQVASLFYFLPRTGLYVIEDIQEERWVLHFRALGAFVYDLRDVKGRHDDLLAIWDNTSRFKPVL